MGVSGNPDHDQTDAWISISNGWIIVIVPARRSSNQPRSDRHADRAFYAARRFHSVAERISQQTLRRQEDGKLRPDLFRTRRDRIRIQRYIRVGCGWTPDQWDRFGIAQYHHDQNGAGQILWPGN